MQDGQVWPPVHDGDGGGSDGVMVLLVVMMVVVMIHDGEIGDHVGREFFSPAPISLTGNYWPRWFSMKKKSNSPHN